MNKYVAKNIENRNKQSHRNYSANIDHLSLFLSSMG
jgi:hypothetical protein